MKRICLDDSSNDCSRENLSKVANSQEEFLNTLSENLSLNSMTDVSVEDSNAIFTGRPEDNKNELAYWLRLRSGLDIDKLQAQPVDANSTVNLVETETAYGTKYYRVTTNAFSTFAGISFFADKSVNLQSLPVNVGETWTFVCWARAVSGYTNTTQMYMRIVDESAVEVETQIQVVTGDWQRFEISVTVTSETYLNMQFRKYNTAESVVFDVTGIMLFKNKDAPTMYNRGSDMYHDALIYDSGSSLWKNSKRFARIRNVFYDDEAMYTYEHFENGNRGVLSNDAGAPFVGAPDAETYDNWSILEIRAGAVAGDRWFGYESASISSSQAASFYARIEAFHIVNFAGLRLDDGTDNNYIEYGLLTNNFTGSFYGKIDILARYRTGGGAVTTQLYHTGLFAQERRLSYKLELFSDGKVGAAFKTYGKDYTYITENVLGGARTWTATRVGLTHEIGTANNASLGWFDSYWRKMES